MNKGSILKTVKRILIIGIIILGIFMYFNRKISVTVLVRKVDVKNREVRKTVSASGIVASDRQVNLSFLASGNISKILVSENEKITKGQLLAYLNPSVQIQATQASKDARDMIIRQKDLFENKKRANTALLGGEKSYNIKLREIDEGISQAEASYKAQQALLSNYYIYAPFDGTVVGVSGHEGEVAVAGVSVVTLADLDDIVFEVVLDQEDYANVKEGQEVEIELDTYKNEKFKGRVELLPFYSDPMKGGFVVKNKFESNGKDMRIGMTGEGFMVTDKTDAEVPSLIFNEISYDADSNPFVWILDGSKVKKLPIEIGLEGDLYTEIKTDLSGKTILVTATEDAKIEEGFTAKIIN